MEQVMPGYAKPRKVFAPAAISTTHTRCPRSIEPRASQPSAESVRACEQAGEFSLLRDPVNMLDYGDRRTRRSLLATIAGLAAREPDESAQLLRDAAATGRRQGTTTR